MADRLRRAPLALVCLVVAACSSAGPVSAPARPPPPSSAATAPPPPGPATTVAPRPQSYGPFGVVTEDLALADLARPTAANNAAPARPGRLLPTRVYLPSRAGAAAVADGPFPMFVWSHGFAATVGYFDSLLRAWAGRGYVVVAPTFPLTNAGAPGGPRFGDYVNQPADVTFVISEVLSRDGPAGTEHRGLVDPLRIGAGGHSLGAVTTTALVANRCCLDPRVNAAAAIDGGPLPFPGGADTPRGTPLLLVHGDADTTFPVRDSQDLFSRSMSPKYLVVLRGVPHTPFGLPRAEQVILATVADFLDLYLKQRPGSGGQLARDGNVAGLATLSAGP